MISPVFRLHLQLFKMMIVRFYLMALILLGGIPTVPGAPLTDKELKIDFQAKVPPFINNEQISQDLLFFEHIIRESFGQWDRLKAEGTPWEQLFEELKQALLSSPNPVLTQHFQQKLIDFLSFTGDPAFKAQMKLYTRDYSFQVENRNIPFYSSVELVQQNKRFRVLPNTQFPSISNDWLMGCFPNHFKMFPVLPQREGEPQFLLGILAKDKPRLLHCVFANDLNKPSELDFGLKAVVPQETIPQDDPVFEWIDGPLPYIRWYREGRSKEKGTRQFYKVSELLLHKNLIILDVRGNLTGSFAFIEEWLKPLTRNVWKNVIVREKYSLVTLRGLLNRLQSMTVNIPSSNTEELESLFKKRQQLIAMMTRMQSLNLPAKWVETKFIFSGNSKAPEWNKILIVITDRNCGDGCQFLAALAKQQENAYLIGENTGAFPKNRPIPLFQLPQSKILFSVNHSVHLDHNNNYISPAGYEPDYWILPGYQLPSIYRFATSLIQQNEIPPP
ncbi:peptidase S41 [Deltaproteobacteria bacterium TL4]